MCPLADTAIKINKGGRGRSDAAEGGAAFGFKQKQTSIILDTGELRSSGGGVTVDLQLSPPSVLSQTNVTPGIQRQKWALAHIR